MNRCCRFYLDNGFDVLWVRTDARQLMMPASSNGSQKVAKDVLDFLLAEKNRCYQNMMLHSFSIGGYQWGECLVKIRKEPEKYKHIEDIMKAQVNWLHFSQRKDNSKNELFTNSSI